LLASVKLGHFRCGAALPSSKATHLTTHHGRQVYGARPSISAKSGSGFPESSKKLTVIPRSDTARSMLPVPSGEVP
jgi:hypothetical protein